MALHGGVNNIIAGDRIITEAAFDSGADPPALIETGTATVSYYKIGSDASVTKYDFNDNAFKSSAWTTPTKTLTHRLDGIWTSDTPLIVLTGFARGDIILQKLTHSTRGSYLHKIQYGRQEVDVVLFDGTLGTFASGRPAVNLPDGSITSAKFSVAAYSGVATGILERIDQLWRYFFKKAERNSTSLITFADDGTTPMTTHALTDNGIDTETRDAAS